MRILMLTPRLPYPPNRGDTLRSWQMLKALSTQHEVSLAAVDSASASAAQSAVLNELCDDFCVAPQSDWRNLLKGIISLTRGNSLTEGYHARTKLDQMMKRWSDRDFDAVLAFSGAMAPMALRVPADHYFLDLVDADSAKWEQYAQSASFPKRWLYRLEHQRVTSDEQRWIQCFDRVWVVNDRERAKLIGSQANSCVRVLPMPVDLPSLNSEPVSLEPRVTMCGSMFYQPNARAAIWFGRQVWPLVRAEVPDAEWFIVGSRPTQAVRELGNLPGITVTGTVPEVETYLKQTRVFVSPVRGTLGVQTKVLNALAAGLPCVVHADVAGGLVDQHPHAFLTASTPESYAHQVVELLREHAQCQALASRARAYVQQHYASGHVMEQWLDELEPQTERLLEPANDSRPQHHLYC